MSSIQLISLIAGIVCGVLLVMYVTPTFLSPAREGETLFVYGTLRNEIIRYVVSGQLVPETPVTLRDYKKVARNIIPSPGDSVDGAFIVVSPEALTRIDRYERIPERYRRERLEIAEVDAWVYIRNEE